MKKMKLDTAKLQLNKERILSLNQNEMRQLLGGATGGGCVIIVHSQAASCGPFSCDVDDTTLCPGSIYTCIPATNTSGTNTSFGGGGC